MKITDKLNSLNQREQRLYHYILSNKGSIEDINNTLIINQIPEEYDKIFCEYSRLAANLEALKRGVFLQWFAVSEPFTYTGMASLNKEAQKVNISLLSKLFSSCSVDNEFHIMLNHYYNISSWYFDSFLEFKVTMDVIQTWENLSSSLKYFSMKDRGRMGEYWESLVNK
jgi:hypothetical protein